MVKVDNCPFCGTDGKLAKRSKWYYDGELFVVADDAGKQNTLILFPHQHETQSWLKERKVEVEKLMLGIANALWGRDTKTKFDWLNLTYPHAHCQLFRENR